jgi:hypothetical protein
LEQFIGVDTPLNSTLELTASKIVEKDFHLHENHAQPSPELVMVKTSALDKLAA